jgi:hypothetical protein
MELSKPHVKDYAPLICRTERRMSASSQFLSYAGRLQLVNHVLSSLPAYYMCSLKLPITVIDVIDNFRKNCLWRGKDFNRKGYNLAAWDLVRLPKNKGGLGVINLSVHNDPLLLKHLEKFYKKENVQWVNLIWDKYYRDSVPHLSREKGSFWWKDILRMYVYYRGVAIYSPSRGDSNGLWDDLINGSLLSEVYPKLFSFSSDPKISLWKVRQENDLLNCFKILMSREAYTELLELQQLLGSLQPTDQSSKDPWHFIWGQKFYSPRKFYQYHFKDIHHNQTVLWIWKSKCVPTIRLFAWLLLNDRLNTKNVLKRRKKHLDEGYNCVLCSDCVEETVEHLFFDCSAARCR